MSDILLIADLFGTFFLIGMFTFGGGYAVISLIQSEIVFKKGWISEAAFTDISAIAQMTPGPVGLNCSTYTGYEVAGFWGSMAASVAVVLPSFLIMLAIVRFYFKFHESGIFKDVMGSLKPAIAGLIGAAALGLTVNLTLLPCRETGGLTLEADLVRENFPEWKSWAFATAAFIAYLSKVSPIKIIAGAALLGIIVFI